MARVIYASKALADLDRLVDFLIESDPAAASKTIGLITEAVQILANHPQIGRVVEHGFRELVISRGGSGYLALYHLDVMADVVLVLAVRHQREAGYESE